MKEVIINNFKFKSLAFLEAYQEDIPCTNGIYTWVFYPNLDPQFDDYQKYIEKLNIFTKIDIFLKEKYQKFKFTVEVYESGFPKNGNLFGLSNKKDDVFKTFLLEQKNRVNFELFFKLICFSRPFYIGKALNLRSRICQHINSSSGIRHVLEDLEIESKYIWIGYQEMNITNEQDISNIIEEISQRILKPTLTVRPG